MRIVVGVDAEGAYQPALAWIEALRFERLELILASVVETPRPPRVGVIPLASSEALAQAQQAQQQAARERLETLHQQLTARGFAVEAALLHGTPSTKLLELADAREADLIAIGGTRKGAFQAFLSGSVARAALTAARQSILLAYTPPPESQPLHAVLATDHSEYNYRCIELLLQFAPRGIQRIAIATAFSLDEEMLQLLTRNAPAVQQSGVEWIIEQLHERNRQVCERLRPLNASCESMVIEGLPIPAIRAAMQEAQAQLLILGAKGHSLLERLSLGSVSYHFAIGEPMNLLILRTTE